MSGPYRTGTRPASTHEASRHHDAGTGTRRGGATSPSAISSSSDAETGGGASLSASMSAMNFYSSDQGAYAPPHRRSGNEPSQSIPSNVTTGTTSRFQLGNATEDADVFGETVRGVDHRDGRLDELISRRRDSHFASSPSRLNHDNHVTDDHIYDVPGQADLGLESSEYLMSGALGQATSSRISAEAPNTLTAIKPEISRQHVGTVDAQAYYSPAACIFVANLPEGVEDKRLEAEVTRKFGRYGTVFVKIRRDRNNMPFAFCQYTAEDDAKVALANGKGTLIYGRPCRTETSRANRTYIMHRTNGDDLDVGEARTALIEFGFRQLERCEPLSPSVQSQQGLSRSVLVKLKTFDPSKELQASFRRNSMYRVIAYDERKGTQITKPDPDENFLKRYEVDRRSIYIGGLPYDMENLDAALRKVLGELGDVNDVTVVVKDSREGREPNVFAFVEFARADMATFVIERLRGRPLFGCDVRFEHKVCRDVKPREVSSYSPRGRGDYQRAESHDNAPETPARMASGQNRPTGTPGLTPVQAGSNTESWAHPYGGLDWASPPNYTTSPYAATPYHNQFGAGGYQLPGTPQMPPAAYAPSPMSPYGIFHAPNFSWLSPYLADPATASQAIAHAYNYLPVANAEGGATGGEADGAAGQAPDTPTRHADEGRDRAEGSRGARYDDAA